MKHFLLILSSGFLFCSPSFAAGWEQVTGDDLVKITTDSTWKGAGFSVYWDTDGTRRLSNGTVEPWSLKENNSVVCAGSADVDPGERCGIVEIKKGKYRSVRTLPESSKGKKFKFKIYEGDKGG